MNKTANLICICIIAYVIIFVFGDTIWKTYQPNTDINNKTIEEFKNKILYRESMLNSNEYKVQNYNNPSKAADLLSILTKNMHEIIKHLKEKHNEDIRVIRFSKRLKDLQIEEAVHEEDASSYTINKGELMAICLRHKNENKNFHDIQTLMFVLIHELSHVMSVSEGHNAEFMDNFKFILREAKEAGVYIPIDYSHNPIKYCGVKVTHNPYYTR
jgi:hypothetical protein